MRHRIESVIGWKLAAGILVCNFHQLCLRILRSHTEKLGFSQPFSVLGAEEQKDVVRDCIVRWEAHDASRTAEEKKKLLAQFAADYQFELQESDELMNEALGASRPTQSSFSGFPLQSTRFL